MTYTYTPGHVAHYGDKFVMLPDQFDLGADYASPKIWPGLCCTNTGRLLGQQRAVLVDHIETGTNTPGTGDTVVYEAGSARSR